MKELRLTKNADNVVVGEFADIEKPVPKDDQVLIKVVVTGTNPKDWKYIGAGKQPRPFNSGDDIAGIVESVGSKVFEFKPGDRVAAFHVMHDAYGSFAEYAIAPSHTTFFIPPNISFEQAATIPLVALTSAIALYQELALPTPWSRGTDPKNPKGRNPIPIVIYGGTTSVGLTALKFARLSGLYPIITIAGGSKDIIEKDNLADVIIDYRNNPNIADEIRKALNGQELKHAFDGFAEPPSSDPLAEVLSTNGGRITGILQYGDGKLPNGHKWKMTYVGSAHKAYPSFPAEDAEVDREFAYVFSRYLTRALEQGKFKPHPHEVLEGGLGGIVEGLNRLREGKVKGSKLVARIADTEGL
ncbi:Zeta-crystallin [Arthrobotrys entomopaga]|nr:Zeta-crystallin [Arthrobotrys entomopaga]